jgi:hypothetical protein
MPDFRVAIADTATQLAQMRQERQLAAGASGNSTP